MHSRSQRLRLPLMSKRVLRSACTVAVFSLLLTPRALLAQGGQATLTGTVTDETAAVVPGAAVTLTNQASGARRVTESNNVGFFSFTGVPPATYSVAVEKAGFSKFVRTDVAVHAADQLAIKEIVLKPGAVTEVVEVVSVPAQIPTDTDTKAETITATEIQNLAVVGRSAIELLKILPGTVNQGGSSGETVQFGGNTNVGIGSYSVNGGAIAASLSILSDGANVIDTGDYNGVSVTPNMDMVQEFKVETANYSADNPKGPNVIQTITKSGSREFHGSAYYYMRHFALNSNDWLNNKNNVGKPRSRYHFPGFNIGGPLTKGRDKLFFFAAFEAQRQGVDLGLKRAIVPTAAMRQGDFSDADYINSLGLYGVQTVPCQPDADGNLPIAANGDEYCASPGMINPDFFDPGGQILMNLYPLPTGDPQQHDGYNFLGNIVNPQNRTQSLVRLDYNISDNTKLYTRYNYETESVDWPYTVWWSEVNAVPYPSKVVGKNRSHSIATTLTHVFSPTLTNEVTVAMTWLNTPNKIADPAKVSRQSLGYPYRGFYDSTEDLIPNVTNWGEGVADIVQPGGFLPDLLGSSTNSSVTYNLSKVAGTHLLKFGAYYERISSRGQTDDWNQGVVQPAAWGQETWGGLGTGNSYADLLVGYIVQFEQSTANMRTSAASNQLAFYGQDNWKVSRRLMLRYGARFYYMPWSFEKNGLITVFDPARYDSNAPLEEYSGVMSHKRNPELPIAGFKPVGMRFAPHLGFAYDIRGDGNTVLRGGFGTYFYRDQGGVSGLGVGGPPEKLHTVACCALKLPEWDEFAPSATLTSLAVLDPYDNRVPHSYSYSLTLSRRLPAATVLELSYVGNSSHNLPTAEFSNNINPVPEGSWFGLPYPEDGNFTPVDQTFRPFPTYLNINQVSHVTSSHYDSLQVTARRQTGRFNYWASYTWGKALGNSSFIYSDGGSLLDNFDRRGRSYGILPWDRTHTLNLAYNILLPDFGKSMGNHPVTNHILNGWQISGITRFQSGAPILSSGVQPNEQLNAFSLFVDGIDGLDLQPRTIAGTPDTTVHPFLSCNPTENLQAHQVFNADCFMSPSPEQNGLYQLPYIRGPWYNNSDLSIFKNFKLGEGEDRKLQFRFSAFNFLNHPLWDFADANDAGLHLQFNEYGAKPVNTQEAGFITNKRGRRIIQLALKLFF